VYSIDETYGWNPPRNVLPIWDLPVSRIAYISASESVVSVVPVTSVVSLVSLVSK
jgi:hypothetical protein